MIILNPDGSMAYTFSNDVPPGCVRVNADSTLYTPSALIPAPAPLSLVEQQAKGWEEAAVQARLRAAASEVARLKSLEAAEAGKTAGEDLGGETYKLKI